MEIQELMAAPISLSLETVIDGSKFYSSDKLKRKFVEAFAKSSKGKDITSQIESLVEKKFVMPCYKSKGLFSFIKRKLIGDPDKYILGFYHIKEKRVIVLIENSVSIIGTAANNELVSTTMHECMHLIAGRNFSKFTQVFSNYLNAYYTEFVKHYFNVDSPDQKSIREMMKFIAGLEKRGPGYANSQLKNYYRLMYSLFGNVTVLTDQDFDQRLTDMVVALKLMIMHIASLMKNARKYQMLFTSLNSAYYNAFGKKNQYTTPIQELISLSEIACVFAEMAPHDSVIKRMFKIIA